MTGVQTCAFFFSSRRRHTRYRYVTGVRRVLFRSIQTTASGRSVRAAASTIVGARAPLDEACAKIIGMTSALKLESFMKASRQNPNVSDVFKTSAVRSDGLATEPKSGTT